MTKSQKPPDIARRDVELDVTDPELRVILADPDIRGAVKWNVNVHRQITDVTQAAARAQVEVADRQHAAPARYRMWTCVAVVVSVLLALVVCLAGTGWDAEQLSKLQWIFIAGFGVAGVTVVMTFKGKPPTT